MKPIAKIILGVVVVLIAFAAILPALAKMKQELIALGANAHSVMLPFMLTIVLGTIATTIGVQMSIRGLFERKAKSGH